ncbi:low-complexity tail membrane protein [Synechococcus sp. H60.1]|uniref:low-complexity tail membrane protein n=1 Tax=unclassified Synechococcus TaxID=2626047 RepID=UPI0039C2D7DA
MRSHWQEPFLWICAAGILLFPVWLGLTVIGLATGDPLLPVGVEQAAVAVAGIGPVFAMQWRKPFDIFSLWVAAIPPEELTPGQRRILAAFLSPEHKILTVLAALLLLEVFERLYDFAPLFASLTPGGGTRLAGLAIAAFGFWGANLFFQIPIAAVRVLLLSELELAQIDPIPAEEIESRFSVVGDRHIPLLQRLLRWVAALGSAVPPQGQKDENQRLDCKVTEVSEAASSDTESEGREAATPETTPDFT